MSDHPPGPADTTTVRAASASAVPAGRALVPGITILAHPDVARIGERVVLDALNSGRSVGLSRHTPEFGQPGGGPWRALLDPHLSRQPLRLGPGPSAGSLRLELAGSRTEVWADGQALTDARTVDAEQLERGVVLLLGGHVALLLHRLDPLADGAPTCGLVGASHALERLRREITRVAASEVTVLVAGETGSGKELVARALHDLGPRRGRPYVAVNLGAVPPALAAAELFGAARGAFTGADRERPGYFARAQHGTLFLDEIGEASAEVQVLLLRALESGEVQAVGGEPPRRVDVRVIAASDADLATAAAQGRFRAPLLHRLSSYRIDVPPLRARRDDVARLLVHFLRQELRALDALAALETPAWLAAPLVARLCAYSWPGNVRQLRNVARSLALGAHDAPSVAWDLVEPLLSAAAPGAAHSAVPPDGAAPSARRRWRTPASISDAELRAALERNGWRVQPTAAQLNMSRASLYMRMKALPDVRQAADLGPAELRACQLRCGGDLERMAAELRVSPHALRRRLDGLGFE